MIARHAHYPEPINRDPLIERRRLSFGGVAEQYEATRPTYPPALVADLVARAGCTRGDPVLEVGAGTGKATRLFAAHGLRLLALEPDARMAAVASRQAATAETDVRIEVVEFEHAVLPERHFRLLYAAQAWHWVDAAAGYRIAARVLVPGGLLAAFWNRVDWSRSALRDELTEAYARSGARLKTHGPMFPGEPTPLRLGDDWIAEVGGAAGLGDAEARTYEWTQRLGTAEYVTLLATHSDHIMLDPADRARLLDGVAAVLDAHGGEIELPYRTLLCTARATPAA